MQVTSYAIAGGSNRRHGRHGGPPAVLAAAARQIEAAGARIVARAPVIETAALGPAGRRFANTGWLVNSALAPPALLAMLKAVERDFGRRSGRRWGARVLDLDIILWSGGRWRSPGLTIPHPAFRDRLFVLQPLSAIAPGWRDPASGRTLRQLLARLQRRR